MHTWKPHWLVQPEASGHKVNFMVMAYKLLENPPLSGNLGKMFWSKIRKLVVAIPDVERGFTSESGFSI